MVSNANKSNEENVILTTCNMHCGGQCILKVHVKNGSIVRIETDDGEEPQYRACLKGRAQRQRVYAPDRLKWPMKRIGDRGEGRFKRISWDEALDTVASELKRVKEKYGPAAILFIAGGGDFGWLADEARLSITRTLSKLGGYTGRWSIVSFHAAMWASLATYGCDVTCNSRDDLVNSRLIIMWGWDPAQTTTETRSDWCVTKAREAGARIVVVDPKYSDSAATFAHQWIPILPGSDAAMLIAMAYVIIVENLQDQKFLDAYTIGFDRFKDYVLGKDDGVPKTPSWAYPITGVPAITIEKLAKEYASTKPAALMPGAAPGRTVMGEQYHRAAITLAAMTGNIGISGGGPSVRTYQGPEAKYMKRFFWGSGSTNPVDTMVPARREHLAGSFDTPSSAAVHYAMLGDALLKGKAGGYFSDYKLLYVFKHNAVTQVCNTNRVVQALKHPGKLEFIVVHEQFMTPTAKFADILLPHSTFFEREDVYRGHSDPPFTGYKNKAIEPLGESRSPAEIARGLAERLGVVDEILGMTDDEYLRRTAERVGDIPDFDAFKKRGYQKYTAPEPYSIVFKEQIEDPANNPFPTPSGKIEIYSQRLADMNHPLIPPIPKYIPGWESISDPLALKYPLQLITSHARRRAHSKFDNIPWLREVIPHAVLISSADADARGISDGDLVRVFNDRGKVLIRARVTERIMPGVAEIPAGAWYDPDENGVDRGGCANVLTKDDYSPCGAYVTNGCLVQIEKASGET